MKNIDNYTSNKEARNKILKESSEIVADEMRKLQEQDDEKKREEGIKETSEKFNVNYHTLKQNLIRFGYRNPKKKLDHQRVEKICYFDSIDTPEKAYILGFLFFRQSVL